MGGAVAWWNGWNWGVLEMLTWACKAGAVCFVGWA